MKIIYVPSRISVSFLEKSMCLLPFSTPLALELSPHIYESLQEKRTPLFPDLEITFLIFEYQTVNTLFRKIHIRASSYFSRPFYCLIPKSTFQAEDKPFPPVFPHP